MNRLSVCTSKSRRGLSNQEMNREIRRLAFTHKKQNFAKNTRSPAVCAAGVCFGEKRFGDKQGRDPQPIEALFTVGLQAGDTRGVLRELKDARHTQQRKNFA
jgi:hypothetical protein